MSQTFHGSPDRKQINAGSPGFARPQLLLQEWVGAREPTTGGRMKNSIVIAATGLLGLLAFQNCGKVNFKSANGSPLYKLDIAKDPAIEDPPLPPATSTDSDDTKEGDASGSVTSTNTDVPKSKHGRRAWEDESDESGVKYRCFVNNKKSDRIAIKKITDEPDSLELKENETYSVCITRHACEVLAADKFDQPKSDIHPEAVCAHNPHNVELNMSDDDFKVLLDHYKK